MCGICGFISKKNITLDDLTRMNDTMYHRGPDDSGQEIYVMKGGYNIGLAQRRLSILDLSVAGHQPMHSPDRRISVVFNGEIYNYRELKQEISDYPFVSNCDTEVIIAAYLKWGIHCVNHFNGMFAIAIYDRDTESLFLFRDRIGKKPLYYALTGNGFIFGSELKPIMTFPGFNERVRADVLPRYLVQQYINAPDTIFENVYKLEPGAILTYRDGHVEKEDYWDLTERYHNMNADPVKGYEEAKAGLKELLRRSVGMRMISDVPLGSFLSGGYDSSLITAIAQELSSEPVKTFSIGFYEDKWNEAPFAKAVADHLGTDHTEYYIDEAEMLKQVRSIPKYYDEPFADSSQIPTMLVSALAKTRVTVALSGDGGDEFFCGYNVYELVRMAQRLDPFGAVIHALTGAGPGGMLGLERRLPIKVRTIAGNRDTESKTQFINSTYKECAMKMMANDGYLPCDYENESDYGVPNWQIRRMILDMDTYLPGDILCKVDRASMKYSLESRCPILDKDVMEYSFRIPHSYKYHRGDKKHILKDIAYDYIPRELLDRPKQGFGVPLDKWLRGPLKAQLMDYSNRDFLARQGLFDPDYTYDLVRNYLANGDGGPATGANYSKICWSFFEFQEWYHTYMEK
ncbi:MAG: asparagine synthase (glutamine-hydrolyzing) [Lachnospiraceae bacterium]|nr:asparagine synthase (glutamine-hydrolyzing) [Lachnospiraceae bacterium]